jgi:hypothetical protein
MGLCCIVCRMHMCGGWGSKKARGKERRMPPTDLLPTHNHTHPRQSTPRTHPPVSTPLPPAAQSPPPPWARPPPRLSAGSTSGRPALCDICTCVCVCVCVCVLHMYVCVCVLNTHIYICVCVLVQAVGGYERAPRPVRVTHVYVCVCVRSVRAYIS